ncbi:Fe2+-dependent dioxygenase [Mangrovicella endophytica]|uniref:Fe2+-dependent dioxygenase n=1 Tax=Mangrovicella endophytica TaxID=2066697 RepID=UPI000C9E3928|nr:Fe2+-dependent dioxygenase [Mangrovicella endophytica]
MIVVAPILDAGACAEVAERAGALSFVDGASTAGWHAKLVKKNEQAEPSEALLALQDAILRILQSHATVISACLPARISRPLVSRYGAGMTYGSHVDDAIRHGDPPMRADISFTLFLSDPESYEGGHLATQAGGGETQVKLPAGSAVFYPSDTLHRVTPVSSGTRLAIVGWMQSLVRQPQQRQILHDLDLARRHVFETGGKGPLFDTLTKTHSNLLRLWAEV